MKFLYALIFCCITVLLFSVASFMLEYRQFEAKTNDLKIYKQYALTECDEFYERRFSFVQDNIKDTEKDVEKNSGNLQLLSANVSYLNSLRVDLNELYAMKKNETDEIERQYQSVVKSQSEIMLNSLFKYTALSLICIFVSILSIITIKQQNGRIFN